MRNNIITGMSLRFSTSKKEYHCDGCDGEFPIPADSLYARMAYKDAQGAMRGMVLCIRCACAVASKRKYGKPGFTPTPGSLKLHTLASGFRQTWAGMEAKAARGEDIEAELKQLGVETATKEEEAEMAERKNEERRKRTIHKEKQDLKVLMEFVKERQEKLQQMLDDLAKLHLKETLAWTQGDRKAIEAAKTAYGEQVKEIRKAMEIIKTQGDEK